MKILFGKVLKNQTRWVMFVQFVGSAQAERTPEN